MRSLFVASILLTLGLALPLSAQDDALLHRDSLWNSLRLSGDAAALAPFLADDWLLTHSDGRIQDKTDYLAELASRRRSNSKVENLGVRIRQYDQVAIVTGISVQSGVTDGQPWSGRFRFTRTWIRHDGVWKTVASHTSRCAEAVACEP
jgi:ketosteroid isomerase-like protein